MYEPKDFEETENEGTCGLSVIAVLEHREVRSIKKDWESQIGEWKEYANFRDIEKLLTAHNIKFSRKKGLKARTFPKINTKYAILRVQWIKDDGTEFYWREAPTHTHYVIMESEKGKQNIFCNSRGWFSEDSEDAKNYFESGFISSYIEIEDLATLPPLSSPSLKSPRKISDTMNNDEKRIASKIFKELDELERKYMIQPSWDDLTAKQERQYEKDMKDFRKKYLGC